VNEERAAEVLRRARAIPEGRVTTYADRNPIHFTVEEILGMARQRGWKANWIGEWKHPRDQQMAEFVV